MARRPAYRGDATWAQHSNLTSNSPHSRGSLLIPAPAVLLFPGMLLPQSLHSHFLSTFRYQLWCYFPDHPHPSPGHSQSITLLYFSIASSPAESSCRYHLHNTPPKLGGLKQRFMSSAWFSGSLVWLLLNNGWGWRPLETLLGWTAGTLPSRACHPSRWPLSPAQ